MSHYKPFAIHHDAAHFYFALSISLFENPQFLVVEKKKINK